MEAFATARAVLLEHARDGTTPSDTDIIAIITVMRQMDPASDHFTRAKQCFGPDGDGDYDGGLGMCLAVFLEFPTEARWLNIPTLSENAKKRLARFFASHPTAWVRENRRARRAARAKTQRMPEPAVALAVAGPPGPEVLVALADGEVSRSESPLDPVPAPPDDVPEPAAAPLAPRPWPVWLRLLAPCAAAIVLLLGYSLFVADAPSTATAPLWVLEHKFLPCLVGLLVVAIVSEMIFGGEPRARPAEND